MKPGYRQQRAARTCLTPTEWQQLAELEQRLKIPRARILRMALTRLYQELVERVTRRGQA